MIKKRKPNQQDIKNLGTDYPFTNFNKNGWPECPQCEEDEIYYIADYFECYSCDFKYQITYLED